MRSGVSGDREVVAALNALGKSITVSATDRAAREALEPMRAKIVSNASALTGKRLGSKLASKWGIRRIGTVTGRRRYWLGAMGKAIRVAHLFEFGIARHSMAKGARRREGIMQDVPPIYKGRARTPFVRPAFDQHSASVPRLYGNALMREIERTILRSVGTLRRRRR